MFPSSSYVIATPSNLLFLYETLYLDIIKTDKYKAMNDAELVDISIKLSNFDKILYNQYIEYIGVELTERMEKQQIANIAEVANKNNISLIGKDLGSWESWLISNNLKQTNPEVQSIIRELQNGYMKFIKDYRRISKSISRLEKTIKDQRLAKLSIFFRVMCLPSKSNYFLDPWCLKL